MVSEESRTGDRYHHGNLRAALLDSALDVLTESGVAGFSMREAARRAGVSQSAPKHHFGDARGLLGALATRAYRQLCEQKHRALRALDRVLRGTDAAPTSDEDPALVQSYAVWSLVHGYTTLALEGAIDEEAADPLASDLLPAMLRLVDVHPSDRR